MTTNKKTTTKESFISPTPKCDWKFCRKLGDQFPILVLPLPSWIKGGKKMEMELSLNVCPTHANPDRLDWFMTDDNWSEICSGLSLRRMPIPDRDEVYVIFKALEDRRIPRE